MSHSTGQRTELVDSLQAGDAVIVTLASGEQVSGRLTLGATGTGTEPGELLLGDFRVRQLNGWVGGGIADVQRWRSVDGPGLIFDLDEGIYHVGIVAGEPSLSHSGMKTLLTKTAARFRFQTDHRDRSDVRPEFELGSAVHSLVLGAGPGLLDMEVTDWRSPKVRAEAAAARTEGLIPLRSQDYAKAHAMAAAVAKHARAAELLRDGRPEVSAFARDPGTGVMLRARFDWLRDDGRLVDFKTAADASPDRFARRALDFGYYIQDAAYRAVAEWCGVDVAGFEFVLVESEPPYEVSVCHLGPASVELGGLHARKAIDLYAECVASGEWPSYPDESVEVDLPGWALRDLDYTADTEQHSGPASIFAFLDSINPEGLPT